MRKRGFELSPKCGNVFDDFVVENASKVVRCKSDKLGYNFKIINALVGKGYVPGYKRLNMGLNGFEFIETDKILDNRFIEWSSAQTLDALRFLIQVQRFCIRNNFIPFDPHIANVMFNFYKPQYIDYGTFYTQGNKKQLYNINRNSIARSILHFCKTNTQVVVSRLDAIRRKLNNSNYLKMLDEFDLAIDSINVAGGSSVWIKYGRETIPNTIKGFAGDFKNAKYETIFKVLGETKPKIVLDLGGNKGYFATLASLHGAKVICVDNIDTVVSLGYKNSKESQAKLLFLKDNLIKGIDDKFYNPNYLARFRPDFCMASAIMHHLYRAGMPFQKQFEMFHRFTSKYLFVELICKEDGIDLAGFKNLISKRFNIMSVLPSFPAHRKFALCTKKRIAKEVQT
jgi:hypothetical protein